MSVEAILASDAVLEVAARSDAVEAEAATAALLKKTDIRGSVRNEGKKERRRLRRRWQRWKLKESPLARLRPDTEDAEKANRRSILFFLYSS